MWTNRYGIEMVPTFRHRGYAKWLHRGISAGGRRHGGWPQFPPPME